jgi:hypothetical protein
MGVNNAVSWPGGGRGVPGRGAESRGAESVSLPSAFAFRRHVKRASGWAWFGFGLSQHADASKKDVPCNMTGRAEDPKQPCKPVLPMSEAGDSFPGRA